MNPADRRAVTASSTPTVHLVGAGPGDPDLLTRKAVRCLRQADVILVDDLVSDACLRFARSGCRIVRVGKRGGCKSTPQSFIIRLMIHEARRGECVVRLKGGDPLVFGRAGEEISALRAAGLTVEIVPGITAASAAAATVGASLTHRDLSPGVAFVTGHRQAGASSVRWSEIARSGLTIAVYMGLSEASRLQSDLLCSGLAPTTPLVLVEAASTPVERRVATTIGALLDTLNAVGMTSPCVMLIGAVFADTSAVLYPAHLLAPEPKTEPPQVSRK
ncbi:uroporphyrinogen-III C-methyltransferase [Thiomonas sp.]|uniref:uroporphyrinogen-III C-methyltransferase n=1 Tax=Thiomonas sp. TaxID=2047785 RepID=UPI0026173DEA|nr:uroporphyrinogen-III C-methyltransferase [Thiomonas sp.]